VRGDRAGGGGYRGPASPPPVERLALTHHRLWRVGGPWPPSRLAARVRLGGPTPALLTPLFVGFDGGRPAARAPPDWGVARARGGPAGFTGLLLPGSLRARSRRTGPPANLRYPGCTRILVRFRSVLNWLSVRASAVRRHLRDPVRRRICDWSCCRRPQQQDLLPAAAPLEQRFSDSRYSTPSAQIVRCRASPRPRRVLVARVRGSRDPWSRRFPTLGPP